jgi:hypothetical protein
MNWIKGKRNPVNLKAGTQSVNRRRVRTTGISSQTFRERSHDRWFDLWSLWLIGQRQKRKGSLKQWTRGLFKDEERI